MKRLSLIKRIIAIFCCTLLLSTSIFLSYNTAVHANDDYEFEDILKDICLVSLAIGYIISIPFTGGVTLSTLPELTLSILTAKNSGMNLYDYITSNGDNTYTINEEFIQAVMDAAEQLEAQAFTDKNIEQQNSGYLYNYKWSATVSSMYNHPYKTNPQSNKNMYIMSTEKTGRVAGLRFTKSNIDNNGRNNTFIYCGVKDKNGIISGHGSITTYIDGSLYYNSDNYSSNAMYSISLYDGSQKGDYYSGTVSFGGNFPIFTDEEAMQNYLDTGQGYKDAENYRPTQLFRRHSSYTPTYTGGPVTVNRTVINNINQKITEVDSNDSLSDDQKIEILQQYIFSGGINPTPTPPPGPSDPDYDDNKDLPSGTDLTDTNSWLKKIYLKICQIYAKMNSAVEDAEDAALAKIQESLDEIIVQLKKIKRWTAVDTVIDGVDAIADWLDLIRGVISDGEEGVGAAVTTVAENLADSADSLSTKFPFSIPWDILFFISVLAAEPQVPYFEIPMDIEMEWLDINIHYDFVIDFSQFQWLSDLSRLVLSMTYAVGLLKLTMNIALLKKEE